VQPIELPCTDPCARWCGRGQRVTAAPMPIWPTLRPREPEFTATSITSSRRRVDRRAEIVVAGLSGNRSRPIRACVTAYCSSADCARFCSPLSLHRWIGNACQRRGGRTHAEIPAHPRLFRRPRANPFRPPGNQVLFQVPGRGDGHVHSGRRAIALSSSSAGQ
jgi:hypothetical protein